MRNIISNKQNSFVFIGFQVETNTAHKQTNAHIWVQTQSRYIALLE